MRTAAVLLITVCFAVIVSSSRNEEWVEVGIPTADTEVSFLLSLKMKNLHVLDRLTTSLTTPGSPSFRKWKSMQELNEITRPDQQETKKLLDWLSLRNLKGKHFGNFIRVTGPIRDIEESFDVAYLTFGNTWDTRSPNIHRSLTRPSIPAPFIGFIEIISGISDFPVPSKKNKVTTREISEDDDPKLYYMVPQTLYNQYQVPNVTAVASSPKSSQGVAEFGPKYGIVPSDLTVCTLSFPAVIKNFYRRL